MECGGRVQLMGGSGACVWGGLEPDVVSCVSWFARGPAALQRGRAGGGAVDSLKGCEGAVFPHCCRDGLGTLVVEEVGCQAGRRGVGE